jgi:hypothetical protein
MSIFGESCGRLVSLVICSVLLTSVGANAEKRKGECLLQAATKMNPAGTP